MNLRETPIEAITPTGVRTARRDLRGRRHRLRHRLRRHDRRAAGHRHPRAPAALTLKDAWAEGPKAYLGLAVAGFPNLFIVTGPGSPSVLSNMINSIEQHVEWITDCIGLHARAGLHPHRRRRRSAGSAGSATCAAVADKTLFPRAASWYMGANIPGKPRVFMPYIGAGYRKKCADVAAAGYEGFALAKERDPMLHAP